MINLLENGLTGMFGRDDMSQADLAGFLNFAFDSRDVLPLWPAARSRDPPARSMAAA